MLFLTQPKKPQTMPLLKGREACLAAAKSSLELLLQFQSITAEATQECGTKAKSEKLFVKVTLLEVPWKHSHSLTEGMKRESFYFTTLFLQNKENAGFPT